MEDQIEDERNKWRGRVVCCEWKYAQHHRKETYEQIKIRVDKYEVKVKIIDNTGPERRKGDTSYSLKWRCIESVSVWSGNYTRFKKKSNNLQKCIKILLFYIYMKLNMFLATHRPLSGAQNCTGSLWFFTRGRLLDV